MLKEKAPEGAKNKRCGPALAFKSELQTCHYCNSKSLIGFYYCPYCGLDQDENTKYTQQDIEKAKLTALKNWNKTIESCGITIPLLNVF